ncbi:hypothetical protein DFH28DRAFT_1130117 [Melampsora americana]|nr:hypothetical protein DFH28DRAFT_1130117 [Melampsora americana]
MHFLVGFLLATITATVLAVPSSARCALSVFVNIRVALCTSSLTFRRLTPLLPPVTSGWGQPSHTITGNDLLNNSPPQFQSGPGLLIPNPGRPIGALSFPCEYQSSPLHTTTGNDLLNNIPLQSGPGLLIPNPGQPIDTSGWGQSSHTITGNNLLNNSPPQFQNGPGLLIPN